MFKTFNTFLVFLLMVSFTVFLSGNKVLAGTQLDAAGFHNGEAVKFGTTMLERGEKLDLIGMIKYAYYTNTEVESAIIHAFKEDRSQLENVNYHIEDSTVQNAREEFKQTKNSTMGKYVNELTKGSWHLKKAISSAERGDEKVAMLHAKRGMVLIKQCKIDLKGMGSKEWRLAPDDYDLTAVGAVIDF